MYAFLGDEALQTMHGFGLWPKSVHENPPIGANASRPREFANSKAKRKRNYLIIQIIPLG